MPNMDNWGNSSRLGRPNAQSRAAAAWNRIQDKPSVITVVGSVTPQTVRIEFDNSNPRAVEGTPSAADMSTLVIFGIRDHATLPDTALATGDRIIFENEEYEVQDVVKTIGEIQARAYRQV
jgi:hypothetical protein